MKKLSHFLCVYDDGLCNGDSDGCLCIFYKLVDIVHWLILIITSMNDTAVVEYCETCVRVSFVSIF